MKQDNCVFCGMPADFLGPGEGCPARDVAGPCVGEKTFKGAFELFDALKDSLSQRPKKTRKRKAKP